MVSKTNYCLMQVKSIEECSKGSILQYFGPSLSYHLSLRPLFCLFLSGRLRQVLNGQNYLVWPRKYAHSGFSCLMHSLLQKDTLLRTYFTVHWFCFGFFVAKSLLLKPMCLSTMILLRSFVIQTLVIDFLDFVKGFCF